LIDFDFGWKVYQQNVGILGMQGEGKTSRVKKILDKIPDVARLIWSPQLPEENYGEYGEPIDKVSDILNDSAQIWIGDFSVSTHERVCKTMMARCKDLAYVCDDAHEVCSKQRMPPEFSRLIQSGRNRGLCGIYITPSPNLLNNEILQSCKHIFAYRMQMENQIEWIKKNYFGHDAEILLPSDRRDANLSKFSDAIRPYAEEYDILPEYSFLYRYFRDRENELVLGDQ